MCQHFSTRELWMTACTDGISPLSAMSQIVSEKEILLLCLTFLRDYKNNSPLIWSSSLSVDQPWIKFIILSSHVWPIRSRHSLNCCSYQLCSFSKIAAILQIEKCVWTQLYISLISHGTYWSRQWFIYVNLDNSSLHFHILNSISTIAVWF